MVPRLHEADKTGRIVARHKLPRRFEIGAVCQEKETPVPVNGPSGGPGGNSGLTVSDEDFLSAGTELERVRFSFDLDHQALRSIQFTHFGNDVGIVDLPHHGGFGPEETDFDLHNAHIGRISGTYDKFVTSIEIETDNPAVGLPFQGFSGDTSAQYTYEAPPGFEIVGFFGRSGDLIDR